MLFLMRRASVMAFIAFFIFGKKVSAVETFYLHPDHLGGIGVVTNPSGQIDELLDYDSFGQIRLDQQNSKHNEKRKYIGQEQDQATGLDYFNARYYDPRLGKFISQDPEFWNSIDKYLIDPQQLNSYSYSRNNPLIYKDPLGLSTATYNPIPAGGWRFGQKMGEFNGVAAYYNGIGSSGITYSCVEYAKRYLSQVYGLNNIGKVGDAKTMWRMADVINERLSNSGSAYQFAKFSNGQSYNLPGEGDLLFWTEGKYGHVMVVTEATKSYVEVIDQNASNTAVRRLGVEDTGKGYSITHGQGKSQTPVAGWFSPVNSKNKEIAKQSNISSTGQTPVKSPWYQKFWSNTKQFIKGLFNR